MVFSIGIGVQPKVLRVSVESIEGCTGVGAPGIPRTALGKWARRASFSGLKSTSSRGWYENAAKKSQWPLWTRSERTGRDEESLVTRFGRDEGVDVDLRNVSHVDKAATGERRVLVALLAREVAVERSDGRVERSRRAAFVDDRSEDEGRVHGRNVERGRVLLDKLPRRLLSERLRSTIRLCSPLISIIRANGSASDTRDPSTLTPRSSTCLGEYSFQSFSVKTYPGASGVG